MKIHFAIIVLLSYILTFCFGVNYGKYEDYYLISSLNAKVSSLQSDFNEISHITPKLFENLDDCIRYNLIIDLYQKYGHIDFNSKHFCDADSYYP